MKMSRKLSLATVVVMAAAIGWASPSQGHQRGLSIMVNKAADLTASTNAPSALGGVALQYMIVNGRTNQTARVHASRLATNATFQVMITTTNGTAISAGAMLTDSYGRGKLTLSSRPGTTSLPLPEGLQAVTEIVHVEVLDATSTSMLSGDVNPTAADFHMHAKVRLIPPSGRAFGDAQIKAIAGNGQTRQWVMVHASKLPRKAALQLQVNGVTVGTATTKKNGSLHLVVQLPVDMDPSRIVSIQLLDSNSAVVMSGTLPN